MNVYAVALEEESRTNQVMVLKLQMLPVSSSHGVQIGFEREPFMATHRHAGPTPNTKNSSRSITLKQTEWLCEKSI